MSDKQKDHRAKPGVLTLREDSAGPVVRTLSITTEWDQDFFIAAVLGGHGKYEDNGYLWKVQPILIVELKPEGSIVMTLAKRRRCSWFEDGEIVHEDQYLTVFEKEITADFFRELPGETYDDLWSLPA
ncbi:MAG: hypothetical protein ACE5EQ_08805 [Phycisphaerae bacterium]